MKGRLDVSLILPCYNEAGLFLSSVARIKAVLDASTFSYEVIFVDDASSDGTQKLIRAVCRGVGIASLTRAEVARNNFDPSSVSSASALSMNSLRESEAGQNFARSPHANTPFKAVFHARNFGRGRTVTDGIRAARGTVVGYIDIDCEVDPVYLTHMVSLILKRKADVVIGKRYYRTTPKAMIREILSRGYQWLADTMIGTGKLDTETGYKFFNRIKIVPILRKTAHPGWFWDTEIMVFAKRAGLTIREEPVLFLRRFDKDSSVHIFRDTWDYLINLWKFRRRLS